ncbi:MAG: thioredoxin family protein [Desulfobulbus sp.]|jgi:thioredoxin 1|uniref:thioredoxin family protein n=1 Tax=Desulfobulbus sp. TaxID=895 RepID=UPI002846DDEA|nr:thioredoxin family protein [Desulfobulbus sp.]MDR2549532.1 thioredoxin family protein [Desulfobulbus sp.]
MNIEKLNSTKFEEIIYEQECACLVIFFRKNCHVCKEVIPELEEMEPEYKDKFLFYSVDIEEERPLFQRFTMKSVPQVLFFNKGEYRGKIAGLAERDDIEEKIAEVMG